MIGAEGEVRVCVLKLTGHSSSTKLVREPAEQKLVFPVDALFLFQNSLGEKTHRTRDSKAGPVVKEPMNPQRVRKNILRN